METYHKLLVDIQVKSYNETLFSLECYIEVYLEREYISALPRI